MRAINKIFCRNWLPASLNDPLVAEAVSSNLKLLLRQTACRLIVNVWQSIHLVTAYRERRGNAGIVSAQPVNEELVHKIAICDSQAYCTGSKVMELKAVVRSTTLSFPLTALKRRRDQLASEYGALFSNSNQADVKNSSVETAVVM